MFERYTEGARRVLFFARYESSRLGATSIGTEHLLLGLLRDRKSLVSRILAPPVPEKISSDIEGQSTFREKIPTSVEVPFTAESKQVLTFAAEEADRLLHPHIGSEHLLLALLREEKSVAGATLAKYGLRLADVRLQIVELLGEKQGSSPSIDEIKSLVQQLAGTAPDTEHARELVQRINDALDALRERGGQSRPN